SQHRFFVACSALLMCLCVPVALMWTASGAAADDRRWVQATPPYQQRGDCSLRWSSDAAATDWQSLPGRWASREECETSLAEMRRRATRPLEPVLERRHKDWEDDWKAIPWWKHPLDRLAVWFWLGSNPERDERCLLVRERESWQHARCFPRSEPAVSTHDE